jgi:hypothetical protein
MLTGTYVTQHSLFVTYLLSIFPLFVTYLKFYIGFIGIVRYADGRYGRLRVECVEAFV